MKKLFLVLLMLIGLSCFVYGKSVVSLMDGKIVKIPEELSNKNYNLNTGDFIVIKFKKEYREDWSWITHNWQHAIIFNTNNILLNASGPNTKSEKIDWEAFKIKYPYNKVEQAILVKFDFMKYQIDDMKEFQDKYLFNKPYPRVRDIPYSKYSWETFYCSSLVWRAHKSTINSYIDLDYDKDDMVWPYDLFLSGYGKQYIVKW